VKEGKKHKEGKRKGGMENLQAPGREHEGKREGRAVGPVKREKNGERDQDGRKETRKKKTSPPGGGGGPHRAHRGQPPLHFPRSKREKKSRVLTRGGGNAEGGPKRNRGKMAKKKENTQ